MYDELAHIESLYGSVAEYNRCMWEEQEHHEPTEEELRHADLDMAIYNEKIRLLNGNPSTFALYLKEYWDKKEPKREDYPEYNDWVYAGYDYANNKFLDVIAKLEAHYNIEFFGDDKFYDTKPNHFAISVEYHDHGRIKSEHLNNLTYSEFKTYFRDLHFLGLCPTMLFKSENGHNTILSNCSLGNLRIYDLKMLGIESQKDLESSLSKAGFNEEAFKEEYLIVE